MRRYIRQMMLNMEVPSKRKRGRPQRKFRDVVKEDMCQWRMLGVRVR